MDKFPKHPPLTDDQINNAYFWIGIIIGIHFYSNYKGKMWDWWYYDRIAIFLALGSALIRVGNLMNS